MVNTLQGAIHVADLDRADAACLIRRLRFHSLPFCFERQSFIVVSELPSWARGSEDFNDQERIVELFGGWPLCVTTSSTEDWDTFNFQSDLALTGSESSTDDADAPIGRPPKVPRVAEIFADLYPDGRKGNWKKVVRNVSEVYGESVSLQIVKYAIQVIEEQNS